jgi:anti-anti-sigma factor
LTIVEDSRFASKLVGQFQYGDRMALKKVDIQPSETKCRISFSIEQAEWGALLRCAGRICFREEASQLSAAALGLMDSNKCLVLDLAGIEVIDSAGVGELVLIHMHSLAAKCKIMVVGPSRHVQNLLELTNVASLFSIYPTLDEAISPVTCELI